MGADIEQVMRSFSEEYARARVMCAAGAQETAPVREEVLQCIWYDQLFAADILETDGGASVKVVSPGWWNQMEGPDFQGAQIEINGVLVSGDIEIHLTQGGWRQHGHHLDPRYDGVILSVSLDDATPGRCVLASNGTEIPTLRMGRFIDGAVRSIADRLAVDDYPFHSDAAFGRCSALVQKHGPGMLCRLLRVAGDYRMLSKARTLRENIDRRGADQAIHEALLTACGFRRYKRHFGFIAQQLPYERVRQLAEQDALRAEAALLQVAGLLPDDLPEGSGAVPHFDRLHAIRREHLPGLKRLPLPWSRTGVRPNNYPERRLAGVARIIARTAARGLEESLLDIWRAEVAPLARRRMFESLFPAPLGFWAEHCTWTGNRMARPSAPLGAGRARSIIGNVFIPAALAHARHARDRLLEETAFDLFAHLPKESENHILKIMIPRIFTTAPVPRLGFREQQGLLQLYQDWCEPNPSCRNCMVIRYLTEGESTEAYGPSN